MRQLNYIERMIVLPWKFSEKFSAWGAVFALYVLWGQRWVFEIEELERGTRDGDVGGQGYGEDDTDVDYGGWGTPMGL